MMKPDLTYHKRRLTKCQECGKQVKDRCPDCQRWLCKSCLAGHKNAVDIEQVQSLRLDDPDLVTTIKVNKNQLDTLIKMAKIVTETRLMPYETISEINRFLQNEERQFRHKARIEK